VLEGQIVTEQEKEEILDDGAREAERVRREAVAGSWTVTGKPRRRAGRAV
jgi:hypothetical protein